MWYMHVHRWSRFFAEYCLFYFSVGERLIDTLFAPSLQLTWFDWLDSKSIHHCIFWRLTGSRVSIAVVCVSVPIWLWSYQITIHRIWKSSVLSIKYSISTSSTSMFLMSIINTIFMLLYNFSICNKALPNWLHVPKLTNQVPFSTGPNGSRVFVVV